MVKQVWLNLPVKDVQRSKEFFKKLGFAFNEKFGGGPDSACMLVSEQKLVVMLFAEKIFGGFTRHPLTDTKTSSELLISIDAESRAEVDGLARKAEEAGGEVWGKPAENQGWMYGCGFSDLDGHRWNVLYMDMNKMPK